MYKIITFSIAFLLVITAKSATVDTTYFKQIRAIEQKIKYNSHEIIEGIEAIDRFKADSTFTRGLISALKQPYSFYYTFDSLRISVLTSPDSSFKIFTWQVMKDFTEYRQRGAIQYNTKDGQLKLTPLFDNSDFCTNPTDSAKTASQWIGMVYYKILVNQYKKNKYYTLLGVDANNEKSSKKYIEILQFDSLNNPVFGADIFDYKPDSIMPPKPCYRFCTEYKKEAGVHLSYDPKADAIILDNLISESNNLSLKHTLVPYGDYSGFIWKNGKWTFTDEPFSKLFKDKKQKELPQPVFD